jgi:transcriptional regulator with XRE-family HTH domain
MAEATTLGTWLRRERERRGVTLTDIAEQTKLSVPLLQGLEADDLSRWPGGIFRRAFARSYATAIGVDPDLVVRRLEEEHPTSDMPPLPAAAAAVPARANVPAVTATAGVVAGRRAPHRTLVIAALLDLLVAGAIGLGFAAAGSRLLWPVLAMATYHAVGMLLTGRSPMLTLLLDQGDHAPAPSQAATRADAEEAVPAARLTDRSAATATRTPTGRLRQPGRRSGRASRARA